MMIGGGTLLAGLALWLRPGPQSPGPALSIVGEESGPGPGAV